MMSDTLRALVAEELAEQASWGREPVAPWRAWLGDPRNESGAGDGGGGDAGAAGGDTGGDTGGGEDGGEGAPDLMSAFESFRGDVLQRFDGIETRLPAAAADDGDDDDDGGGGGEPAPDFFDPRRFSDEDFNDDGFLTRDAQQRALMELVDQRVAEARAPELQRAADERRTSEADRLEKEYPILADPEKRAPVLREAQQRAERMARSLGNPALRDAWREPAFIEMTFLAMTGQKTIAGESPAGGGDGGVVLERGGSAGPGGGSDDGGKATATRIAKLAGSSKYRLGS